MKLSESKLDLKNYLYFHGSRHAGKLSQIDAPTPENIFFVTADLDYAMEYAKFNTQSDARNIYVVTLNEDKLNVFDTRKDDFSSKIKHKWTYAVCDKLQFGSMYRTHGRPDLLTVFIEIASHYSMLKPFDFNQHKYFDKYRDAYMNSSEEYYRSTQQYFDIVDELRKNKQIASILDKHDSLQAASSIVGRKLRSLFCKDLLEEGYNAYVTGELTHNHRSDRCYGIFDKSALETLVLTPIDEDIAKKAIKELANLSGDDFWDFYGDDQRNYSESNAIIHAFMKTYKEMKK